MGWATRAAAMNWTTDKPTKSGWYWWRQDRVAKMCRVWEWWDKKELYVRFEGADSIPVIALEGEWAGPLEPPA
jgi:hypothetical protein